MPELTLPDDAPATTLFPQFESELYRMVTTEIQRLTETQLDFSADMWEWSKWSIRRNVSHVASGDFRWLLLRWGDVLFPRGLPGVGDLDSLAASPHDRRLDQTLYWNMEVILEKLRECQALCQMVLSGETAGSLLSKEIEIAHTAQQQLVAQGPHPRGASARTPTTHQRAT